MKKAVQFGAGNIGRGFLGQLFNQSGYETVFVELKRDIIACLNRDHSYQLRIVGRDSRELTIDKVRVVNGKDKLQVGQEIKEGSGKPSLCRLFGCRRNEATGEIWN